MCVRFQDWSALLFCCILLWFPTSRKQDCIRKQSSEINLGDVNLGIVYTSITALTSELDKNGKLSLAFFS